MNNFIAIPIAFIFCAVVAALVNLAAAVSIYFVYGIIVLSILGAIYLGTGGRAWFGTHEHPDRVLGAQIRFGAIEGLERPDLPNATIRDFKDGAYRAEFVTPVEFGFAKDRFVNLWPRHQGHPISRVSKHGFLFINGELESGRRFIAAIQKD
jgi:hypothetical protein